MSYLVSVDPTCLGLANGVVGCRESVPSCTPDIDLKPPFFFCPSRHAPEILRGTGGPQSGRGWRSDSAPSVANAEWGAAGRAPATGMIGALSVIAVFTFPVAFFCCVILFRETGQGSACSQFRCFHCGVRCFCLRARRRTYCC